MPPESIGFEDIPWPSSAAELLQSLAAALRRASPALQACELQMHPRQGVDTARIHTAEYTADDTVDRDSWRAAFLLASRRWHPDKFEARFGRYLAASKRAAVMSAVQALMQGINEAAACQPR